MAVIYSTAVKNARLNAVVTAIGSTGVLEIGTTAMGAVLATIPLAATAGTVTGGVLTFTQTLQDTSADATGTAAVVRIRTSIGGTDVITGLTVGLTGSGADVILDTTAIVATATISLTSATITHG